MWWVTEDYKKTDNLSNALYNAIPQKGFNSRYEAQQHQERQAGKHFDGKGGEWESKIKQIDGKWYILWGM